MPMAGVLGTLCDSRKLAIVLISTLGTYFQGVVIAGLFCVVRSLSFIVVHLLGKPFDIPSQHSKDSGTPLNSIEFSALTVSFCTFWSGLLFSLVTINLKW